ncbi:MAG: hypothetical protein OEV60_09955 [Actinomycetota bacterium]|nr:hypothetical protein [Actinomycetota bacterium]MDH5223934.1 hypothetical protein [Actinomycetota bacterium]MDH5314248.1 hypothetical protein [Actinomycetota bacterium]
MRRGIGVIALVVVILAGIGIGAGAYRAGERNGVAQGIEQVQQAQDSGQDVQVVHVVGDGRAGFFPGFFLFPLFLIGGFFLIGAIFRRRWGPGGHGGYGGHMGGHGPWNDEGRKRFEERAREWHQREHGDSPPAEATPTG